MKNNAVAGYESMCLSSVLWVCAFLYIQNSEAAIRGFLTKKHRCRKNRTCTRDLWFNTPTHWQNEEIYLLNSPSLCFVPVISVGVFWISILTLPRLQGAQQPADGATTMENPKGQICAPSNKCDIFGKSNTKEVWRSVFATVARLSTAQTSVRFSPCHGRQMIGQQSVIHLAPFTLSWGGGGHLTRRLKTGTTRGENLSSSSPSLSYHAFWKKDNKHRQRYNHALTDPRKRDGSPERSLLSKCLIHLALAENRHFNMTSMFIRVSFST